MITEISQIQDAVGLDDHEREKVYELVKLWNEKLTRNRLRTSYYEGKEGLKNLGIAIPPEFEKVDTVIGWPAKAVDVLQTRSMFDGFVYEGEDIQGIDRIIDENRLKTAYKQAVTSELINSCVFATVGRGADGEPGVVINFHSAETAAALWNYRKKRIDWGFVVVDVDRKPGCSGYVPTAVNVYSDEAVYELAKTKTGWVSQKVPHRMGRPLMEVLAYNPSLKRPFGKSRISRTVMSLTDRAVRTGLRAELGSEFYTTPQKYLLGADDDAFDKPKWQSYIGWIFTAGKDEDGDVPKYGQLQQSSMQPHTDYMRDLAAQFSGETNIPMSCLGVIHDNPASAEAIYAAKEDLIIDAQNLNAVNGDAMKTIMQMALCIEQNKSFSELTDDERSIQAHFKNPAMPSVVSQADAMVKLASIAPWIAETEVFLEETGFDDATRRRLLSDKAKLEAKAAIAQQMQAAQDEVASHEPTMYEISSILKGYSSGKISRENAVTLFARIGIGEDDAAQMLDDAKDVAAVAEGTQGESKAQSSGDGQ